MSASVGRLVPIALFLLVGPLRSAEPANSKRAGPDWWSLQPIVRPVPPKVADADWRANPIDAFVKFRLDDKNLAPNPEADARIYIRRVTLDLTGLLPTIEEMEEFQKDFAANPQAAREKLVDRLLASTAYGERWGRHWLDVVRFAESHGYEMNTLRPSAWMYRDYVIRAFNRDTPFFQFILEQLAADTIPDADTTTQAATGFLVAGPHDLVGNATVEGTLQQRSDDLFDMTATTSSVFLGLTAGCARCHDHKFDPIAQSDFYKMQAVFAGVEHKERPLITREDAANRRHDVRAIREQIEALEKRLDESDPLADPETTKAIRPAVDARRNVERFAPADARFLRFTISATNNGAEPCIDEIEVFSAEGVGNNIALSCKVTASSVLPGHAIHQIAHITDGRFGNSHSWISKEPGKGWVRIDLVGRSRIDRIAWGRDREGKYKDRVPTNYIVEVSLDGKNWKTVAGSNDRATIGSSDTTPERRKILDQLADLRRKAGEVEKGPLVYAGVFRKPEPTHLLQRGDVMKKGDEVSPAAIHGIGKAWSLPKDASDEKRRRGLAEWLADPANPLPARVMVNRVWHYHFGQGIVRTPSDFGFNGDRPSHPELLDWLAAEFQANGGKLKPLHRLIVLSKTYRQSSTIDPAKSKIDANNRLLWRFPSRRLEAEAIRDAILQTSGDLNRTMGGPGYHLWNYSGYVIVFTPKEKLGPDEFRRMIYQFKPRLQQDGTFGTFDCPDGTGVAPRRTASTTPLQALNLLNDSFMHEQADHFAERLKKEGDNQERQITRAFQLTFGREPAKKELDAAASLVKVHGLATLCRALLNANEFVMME